MGKNNFKKEAVQTVVDFLNKEYDFDWKIEDFYRENKDLKNVGIAYTTTEDGRFDIQFNIDLENLSWTQYLNDTLISHNSYINDEESKEEGYNMKNV